MAMQASMAVKAGELIKMYSDHLMNNYTVDFDAETECLVLKSDENGKVVALLSIVTDDFEIM